VRRTIAHLQSLDETLTLALDVEATPFQRKVWSALRTIPVGETRSYGEVAEAIGAPNAVRAVARACATNPVALVIPCHRVIRANGDLAGYRWGMERKRTLIASEAET
jgi:O-6-methylguanine DNA methyltransferase